MMRRYMGILLGLALSISMLAGCGSSKKPANLETATNSTQTSQETSQISKKVTLTWPCIWVGTDSKAGVIGEIVADFNKEYEGKYEVVLEENTDYQAYRDKLRTSISAGNAPDIFTFDSDIELYLSSGKLLDLTDAIGQDSWIDNFVDNTMQNATYDSKVLAIPYEMGVTPVMYNKRLLGEAGWDKFPESFDELWELCDDLMAKGITPFSQMTGENAWTSMLWYSQIVLAIGGPNVYNDPTDPAFAKAAEVLKKMYDYTTKDAVGAGAAVSGGHFLAEETAIFMNGPWYIGRLKTDGQNNMYENVEIAPCPLFGGGKGKAGGYVGYVNAFLGAGNSNDPTKQEAQIAFLRYLTEPSRVTKLSAESGALFYVRNDGSAPLERLQSQMVEDIAQAPYIIGHFNYMNPAAIANEFPQALSSLVLGELTPEQFVDALNAKR